MSVLAAILYRNFQNIQGSSKSSILFRSPMQTNQLPQKLSGNDQIAFPLYEINPFQRNVPFLYPPLKTFSVVIEMEDWSNMC